MVSKHTEFKSLSSKLRRKRLCFLDFAIEHSGKLAVKIVDVGGTLSFWEMNLPYLKTRSRICSIDIYNTEVKSGAELRMDGVFVKVQSGDATRMSSVQDKLYDIAFSNSVIEHVGNLGQQKRFAMEVQRIAHAYVIQTPCRYFPLEPHFYFLFFAYLPLSVKAWLHRHFDMGWLEKEPNALQSLINCDDIRLLTANEMNLLFPDGRLCREWLMGFVKSYIVLGGA